MMSDAPTRDQIERLGQIRSFPQLVTYLRDELDWPISQDDFENVDDLFYEFTPEELGIDAENAAKIESIKRLRPLNPAQPWGIFFVKFEPRRLPVVALRRLLGAVAKKKRASSNSAERQAWAADDLLFVSNYGEDEERRISFAHFTPGEQTTDLPTLKVLGWDGQDTALHLDQVANTLHRHLIWPEDVNELEAWRKQWRSAFRLHHNEVITTAKNLSVRLASLARDIRDRISIVLAVESKRGPLRQLLQAFQQSLVADLDEKGFADMYAQTITYGLLSARIVDPKHRTAEDFAAHMRTSPFLRELMESFISLGGRKRGKGGAGIDFDELGVSEVIELLDKANMEEVVVDFGRQKQGEDPVIHFYEHFLTEYDKQEKISRGVFYTPKPVVSYIVRSVDELLRSEFGLADGLADTTTWGEMTECHVDLKIPEGTSADQAFVQILDPATGTGTFLVEVIEIVHATMMDKWRSEGIRSEKRLTELWNEYVPQHLLPRLHGYELMMAPYAIAHLKIGLKLFETGYRFESDERARVYLTNALEPAQDHSGKLEFVIHALAHEAEAVSQIKGTVDFTVVIANPPYSGHSSNPSKNADGSLSYAGQLIARYFELAGKPLGEKQPKWLHDDYVKFIRLGEIILHHSNVGIMGLITNHGYIFNPTFRGMRESLLDSFKKLHVLDLGGSVKKQDRRNDPLDENVFDIEQGVAIALFAMGGESISKAVTFSELKGTRQSKYMILSNESHSSLTSEIISPRPPLLLLLPSDARIHSEWSSFISLNEAMPIHSLGIVSGRDSFAIDIDRSKLLDRIRYFCDPSKSNDDVVGKFGIKSAGGYRLANRRISVLGEDPQSFIRYVNYRPFDKRYISYSRGFLTADQSKVMRHLGTKDSLALATVRSVEKGGFCHVFCTREMMGHHFVSLKEANYAFPLHLQLDERQNVLSIDESKALNFDPTFLARFSKALMQCDRFNKGFSWSVDPIQLFYYIYSVLHSRSYRERYFQNLKSEFPRIPFVENNDLFSSLSARGQALIKLHLIEFSMDKQTASPFLSENQSGRIEVSRIGWSNEVVWLDAAKTNAREGHRASIPGSMGFHGVPEQVWDFSVGGYQVCYKWLKDRKGRILADEDITHYQKIIVAISETIRIMSEIDEVIDQHGGWPDAFATKKAPSDG